MKIYLKNGNVLCGYGDNGETFKESYWHSNAENNGKEKAFLSALRYEMGNCFNGFYENALRLCKTGNPIDDYNLLQGLIMTAENRHIEIDSEVYEFLKEYEELATAEAEKIKEARRQEEEERHLQQQWERIKRDGCMQCANCRITGDDDYVCRETGDDLPTKNCPGYVGMTYYLFNFKPFPTDSCPLRYQKNKETIICSEQHRERKSD